MRRKPLINTLCKERMTNDIPDVPDDGELVIDIE